LHGATAEDTEAGTGQRGGDTTLFERFINAQSKSDNRKNLG
jgi:hypothetical protein